MDELEARLLAKLKSEQVGTKEFGEMINQLTAVQKMRKPHILSNPQLISSALQLVALLIVLNYEKANVLTSKSLGFIPRAR